MAFLIIGVIFIGVAIVLFFVQKEQKTRAFSIKSARSATTAELDQMSKEIASEIGGGNWREFVKVSGVIECDRPLLSQLKQEPCVYYTMTVTREYEETVTRKDEEGKTHRETHRGSEVVSSNKQSTPFIVRDRSGQIEVDPEGADIETVKILDEFRHEQQSGGLLSFGNFSLALGDQPLRSNRRTLGYRYCESILPLNRQILAVATVSDQAGRLVLRKPLQSDQRFILSLKTDEELSQDADRGAKVAFYGMIACAIVGVILVLIGLIA